MRRMFLETKHSQVVAMLEEMNGLERQLIYGQRGMGVGWNRVRSCEFNHDRVVVIDSFGVGAYQHSVDLSPLIPEAYLPAFLGVVQSRPSVINLCKCDV
jgi:hypothetical protein